MQGRLRGLALATCLIVAAGCAGSHVTTDYSPSVGFSQFRTFSLVSAFALLAVLVLVREPEEEREGLGADGPAGGGQAQVNTD